MFTFNRSQFSGWIIAKQFGAVPYGHAPVPQTRQAAAETETANPSQAALGMSILERLAHAIGDASVGATLGPRFWYRDSARY
jgi:hypothetical protein